MNFEFLLVKFFFHKDKGELTGHTLTLSVESVKPIMLNIVVKRAEYVVKRRKLFSIRCDKNVDSECWA